MRDWEMEGSGTLIFGQTNHYFIITGLGQFAINKIFQDFAYLLPENYTTTVVYLIEAAWFCQDNFLMLPSPDFQQP